MSFLLPVPPRPECFHTSTACSFKQPPLDGTLTISEIFDWHYLNNPDHVLFVYSPSTRAGVPGLRQISYKEVVPAVHRAGYYVAGLYRINLAADYRTYPVVAMLGITDTITTFTTIVGMLRAGITVFPISPRFSSDVIAHLLGTQKVSHVLVSTEEHICKLAKEATEKVQRIYSETAPRVCPMPEFKDIYAPGIGADQTASFRHLPAREFDMSSTSFLIHSSCSTSHYPKVVRWTSRSNLQYAMAPLFGAQPLCSQVFGCHGIELFHTLGLLFIFFSSSCGLTLATFPPQSPAVTPKPEAIFQGFRDVKPHYALSNPRFIQEWTRDATKVLFMKTFQGGLIYGGKFMSRHIGDYLTNEGVKLLTSYGSTEAGSIAAFMSEYSHSEGWEYFAINPHTSLEFVPIDDHTFKLFLVSTPIQDLPCINALLRGRKAYDTGDLLVAHPTIDGLWKVLGREDDQVMLSTGEVIHPAYLEEVLCDHPFVAAAVIFGQGRSRLGVVVELRHEYSFNPANSSLLKEFLETFWPQVEAMNKTVPAFSRITKEMILVSRPSKPFVFSQKRSPKRPVILDRYQQDIDSLYDIPTLEPACAKDSRIGTPFPIVPPKV